MKIRGNLYQQVQSDRLTESDSLLKSGSLSENGRKAESLFWIEFWVVCKLESDSIVYVHIRIQHIDT